MSSERKISIRANKAKSKYKLIVDGVGSYAEDSLTKLLWVVFKHRCKHFFTEGKWRD